MLGLPLFSRILIKGFANRMMHLHSTVMFSGLVYWTNIIKECCETSFYKYRAYDWNLYKISLFFELYFKSAFYLSFK